MQRPPRHFIYWLGIFLFFLLSTAFPALADGGGWPTATPTSAPVLVPDSNLSPVIAITPISNEQPQTLDRKFEIESDPAFPPQAESGRTTGNPVVSAQTQDTSQSSNSILIIGLLGLVICAGLVVFILFRLRRRNQ